MKKHKLFVAVFTTTYWLKPVWPAEPMLLTSTDGAPVCDAGRADLFKMKQTNKCISKK